MKILIINPPIREWSKPNVFPLGLGYIVSELLFMGHEVEVLDINALRLTKEEVEEKIRNAHFDVVGVGALVTIYKYVKWLAGILKKYHSDKKIIVGGSVATSVPKILLERTEADIACIGEGEETIKDLIISLERGNDLSLVKGILFKDKSGKVHANETRPLIQNLDSIPFPAWDLFPMETYLKNPVGAPNRNKWIDGNAREEVPLSMNLFASRGCPYQCIYCYHDFMGAGHRIRSADSVIKEIKVLFERYRVKYFHFIDDEFVMRKSFVFEFCEKIKTLMKELNIRLTWGCTGRVNLMTEELIVAMVDAGCVSIGYGIESGSQKMLDIMKKGVTVEEAKQAVRLTQKYLGWADCSFMIGTPGETMETIQETIDFCKELNLTPEVIFFVTPYPGTALYQMALQQGKIKDEEEYLLNLGEQGEKVRVNFTEFSEQELFSIQEHIIKDLKAQNTLKH